MAEEGHRVTLNVYDLSQGLARQLSATFLGKVIEGIWHTGIVVYGNEYYFGGGIQYSPAGTTPYGTPVQTIELGVTHVPQDVFEGYLEEISSRFTAETYSLLTHNCNNFSNEVAQFLVGESIPDHILNLPNEFLSSPMGAMMMPMIQQLESTLRAGAVPQPPQFQPSPTQQSQVPQVQRSPAQPTQPRSTVNTSESKEEPNKADNKSQEPTIGSVPPAVAPAEDVAVPGDPLGSARNKVQQEITREFVAIMASGSLRASEAAALATRRVMQKYGHTNLEMLQS